MKKLIAKSIKHYRYNKSLESDDSIHRFISRYNIFTKKETLRERPYVVYGVLGGLPYITHIKAKNLLFQGYSDCWKYFERTAVFNAYSCDNDYFDLQMFGYEYALYVERDDLLKMLIQKMLKCVHKDEYKINKYYIKQSVYPSVKFIHFLIDKWLGDNPIKEIILNYGKEGYDRYQPIVDNWNKLSIIETSYWDELCLHHLNNIGLRSGDKYEEFLNVGLIPMEIINLIKVRKKLGLDIPIINNELFETNMAKFPVIPTGYNESHDVIFQMVKLTVETQRKYSIEEVIEMLHNKYGDEVELLLG